MSTTLTYTRVKPADGDDSANWFDAIESNIEIDDAHNHDGVTSAKLSGISVEKEDAIVKGTGAWTGSAGAYSLTIQNDEIPAGFLDDSTSSSSLCTLIIMDTDNDNERVYLKYTWSGVGGTQTVTLYSTKTLNIKVLFI